jgi:hypothetical protein
MTEIRNILNPNDWNMQYILPDAARSGFLFVLVWLWYVETIMDD